MAAAIVVHGEHVLMVRRRVAEGSLSWQFPAGKIEPGESSEAAAVRETREEAGLRVRAVGQLGKRVHPMTGRSITYIACQVVDGTAHVVDDREVAEVAWCDLAALSEHVPYPVFGPVQDYLDLHLR